MWPGVTIGDWLGPRGNNREHMRPERAKYLWWLSFVDPDKAAPRGEQVPGGPGFLGVAIVEASDLISAASRAWAEGCNPGGEVQGFGPLPREGIPRSFWHRLLTAAEAATVPDPWAPPSDGA